MPRKRQTRKPIERYEHRDKERGEVEEIIDAGLSAETLEQAKAALQELKKRQEPYLNWAGKAEGTTFDVPTVSLHIDPPYGIKYGSNFQPFVNKRDVRDGKDEDLTAEPEMIKAFRDTWELGIHSYLTYLRDRLLLARDLLTERGSVFVQISDENVHRVRCLLEEIFGEANFCGLISFKKTGGQSSSTLASVCDYILWYSKNKNSLKYRELYKDKTAGEDRPSIYSWLESPDRQIRRRMNDAEKNGEIKEGWKIFAPTPLVSEGATKTATQHWKTTKDGLNELAKNNRLIPVSTKVYVVQTNKKVIERCLLMTTDPGDLVFDPTCGSGTTAYVAEQWGRRWITCDTSRVAVTLAKQRLLTAVFDYYELAHPEEGVGSGFKYKTVPHITLKSIANNEPPKQETLYDQPLVDKSRARVTGPFTVEAVPSPQVKPLPDLAGFQNLQGLDQQPAADATVARSGETLRQAEWRDELLRTGIRGKGGQRLQFSRVEPLSGTRWLHADAETVGANGGSPERTVIAFGPEHAPLEQRQVALAIEEAQKLVPKPKIIVFAAFQLDPEAAKDIDETDWPGVTLLKAQMNADLLTEDLKKKRASNESFWLVGQPDVSVEPIKDGDDKGKYRVEVHGFDYYNTREGILESGGTEKIALWMLDPDYDGRSLYPRQVFFPMAGEKEGWARLARNLKAEIDEELIEAYRGTVSLPFEAGDNKRVAVKIVDDRGIESLKIIDVE